MLKTFHNLSTVETIPSISHPQPESVSPPTPPPADDDIEAEPVFANISDARRALATRTSDMITRFYKRPPMFDTDITFSCVKQYVPAESAYMWWVPFDHPITEVLKNHTDTSPAEEGFPPEEIFTTDFGNVAVFSDLAVITCVRAIANMCRDNDIPLTELITETDILYLEQQLDEEEEYESAAEEDDSSEQDMPFDVIVEQTNEKIN
jgi:hypothetical protein